MIRTKIWRARHAPQCRKVQRNTKKKKKGQGGRGYTEEMWGGKKITEMLLTERKVDVGGKAKARTPLGGCKAGGEGTTQGFVP